MIKTKLLSSIAIGPLAPVFRHLKLFACAFAVTFALVAGVILVLPTKYESEMKLLVNNERQDLVISPQDDKNTVHAQELAEIRVNSEIELLKSADVLKQVVLKTGLGHEPGTVRAAGAPSPVYLDRAVRSLYRHLEITPVKKSDIITVAYRAKSPELANAVMTRLADTYLGMHLQAHGTPPGSFHFFEEQANAYAKRLDDTEAKLKAFREKYAIFVEPDQKDILTQRAIEAQAALEDADAQSADYRERVKTGRTKIGSMEPRVTAAVRTSPQALLIGQLTETLNELQNRRTEMLTKFRADDRFVTELDKEIADTTAMIERSKAQQSVEQSTDINQIRQDAEKNLVSNEVTLAGLQARKTRLGTLSDAYKTRMVELAGASTENDHLVREVKEDEDNYLLYSQKREEARIAESLDRQRITNVSLIEAPTMPVEPASPVVLLDLAIGFVLSLLIAFLAVRMAENSNPQQPIVTPSLGGERTVAASV